MIQWVRARGCMCMGISSQILRTQVASRQVPAYLWPQHCGSWRQVDWCDSLATSLALGSAKDLVSRDYSTMWQNRRVVFLWPPLAWSSSTIYIWTCVHTPPHTLSILKLHSIYIIYYYKVHYFLKSPNLSTVWKQNYGDLRVGTGRTSSMNINFTWDWSMCLLL